MAKGGMAGFCLDDRPHKRGCQYFAEGGAPAGVGAVPPTGEPQAGDPVPEGMMGPQSGDPVPADMMVADEPKSGDPVPVDMMPTKADKYNRPGQGILAEAEGLAQGVLGPLATSAELGLSSMGVPGISAEDIAGRQETFPNAHAAMEGMGIVGSMLTGVGEAALIEKAMPIASEFTGLMKIGAAAAKSFITNGLIQGGDEISKAMLGQGDPEAPVASALVNMGKAGAVGALFGGAGATASMGATKGLRALAGERAGGHIQSFVSGLGAAASHGEGAPERTLMDQLMKDSAKANPELYLDMAAYKAGKEAFDTGMTAQIDKGVAKAATAAGMGIGGAAAEKLGLHAVVGAGVGAVLGPVLASPIAKILGGLVKPAARKVAIPAVMRLLQAADTSGLLQVLNHAERVQQGADKIAGAVGQLFSTAAQQHLNKEETEASRDKLRDYIENGGIDQNIKEDIYREQQTPDAGGFAKGGEVVKKAAESPLHDDALATHFPEQNLLLSAAKGRVSTYLKSLQPQKHAAKMAFDDEPDNREHVKSYNQALDVANNPLLVMDEIKRGTVEPSHVAHLSAMFPEVTSHLQKKVTERIIQAQLDGEKPSYKVRQGLSMFMGTALDSTLTPANIVAAQSVFAKKGSAPRGQGGEGEMAPKTTTTALGKAARDHMTSDQARSERQKKV